MGKRESKETPNISKMREILSKNRSSTADFKSTLEYFKSFKYENVSTQARGADLRTQSQFLSVVRGSALL